MLAEREHDRLVPLDPLLKQRDVLVEPSGVLVGGLDRPHLGARKTLLDEVAKRLVFELHFVAPSWSASSVRVSSTVGVATSKSKSSGRSQNSRNSCAQLSDNRIDSAYIRCTDSIISPSSSRWRSPCIHSRTGTALRPRSSRISARRVSVASGSPGTTP